MGTPAAPKGRAADDIAGSVPTWARRLGSADAADDLAWSVPTWARCIRGVTWAPRCYGRPLQIAYIVLVLALPGAWGVPLGA